MWISKYINYTFQQYIWRIELTLLRWNKQEVVFRRFSRYSNSYKILAGLSIVIVNSFYNIYSVFWSPSSHRTINYSVWFANVLNVIHYNTCKQYIMFKNFLYMISVDFTLVFLLFDIHGQCSCFNIFFETRFYKYLHLLQLKCKLNISQG